MKLKVLFTSVLLTLCVFCKAQPTAPVIKVLNGTGFKQNETVKYALSSPKAVYYYVGIEQLLDNKWREIILDITTNVPDKAAFEKKLNEKKLVNGVYRLNISIAYRKNGHVFRLRMNYGPTAESIEKVVVSGEFKVE